VSNIALNVPGWRSFEEQMTGPGATFIHWRLVMQPHNRLGFATCQHRIGCVVFVTGSNLLAFFNKMKPGSLVISWASTLFLGSRNTFFNRKTSFDLNGDFYPHLVVTSLFRHREQASRDVASPIFLGNCQALHNMAYHLRSSALTFDRLPTKQMSSLLGGPTPQCFAVTIGAKRVKLTRCLDRVSAYDKCISGSVGSVWMHN